MGASVCRYVCLVAFCEKVRSEVVWVTSSTSVFLTAITSVGDKAKDGVWVEPKSVVSLGF